MLCAPCDRSGRSAWSDVVPGLTPNSIQQKYAETVASTWIAPGCVQFLGEEKRFHTAWVKSGKAHREQMFSVVHPTTDIDRVLDAARPSIVPIKIDGLFKVSLFRAAIFLVLVGFEDFPRQ